MIGGLQNGFSLFAAQHVRVRGASSAVDTLTRLVTGVSINAAADGPAALIAGLSFDSTLAVIDAQSQANVSAANQADVADAALDSISSLLNDAKSVAVANASNTLSDAEKQANQVQLDSIVGAIDRISGASAFNGKKLLDGRGAITSADDSLALSNTSSDNIGEVTIDGENFTLADIGSGKKLNVASGNAAGAATVIDQTIDDISTLRGQIGAFAQGAAAGQGALLKSRIGAAASLSMIRDADYAMETSRRIREQILAAAGNMAMGYAGATPGGMLSLFA